MSFGLFGSIEKHRLKNIGSLLLILRQVLKEVPERFTTGSRLNLPLDLLHSVGEALSALGAVGGERVLDDLEVL